ncbi:MAG: YraN family protein [Acidobacteria bacterium]|nr:MAG: YraN family protein [Acidobacteriota bacterium]
MSRRSPGRTERGRRAERLAARFLAARGYHLLARNVRLGPGEIDIIARDGEEIVFVEVRSRRAGSAIPPEATVGRDKRRRLADAAAQWLERSGVEGVYCRFDVVAVEMGSGTARIRHYRGAFVDEDGGVPR